MLFGFPFVYSFILYQDVGSAFYILLAHFTLVYSGDFSSRLIIYSNQLSNSRIGIDP